MTFWRIFIALVIVSLLGGVLMFSHGETTMSDVELFKTLHSTFLGHGN